VSGPAVVPDLVPTTSEAFDGKDPPRPRCEGCGRDHGSVGVHLQCLGIQLRYARARARRGVCSVCRLNLLSCVCVDDAM
jgi:hypothetical protein